MSGVPSLPTGVQSRNPDEAPQADQDWATCSDLALQRSILDCVAEALDGAMIVGERRTKQLLYLIITTRLLDRPVSAAVKGPSAAGKSFLVERVLALFPPDACHSLTAMSEKALAYSRVPLQHRFLVLFEAAGLQGDFASYLVRSLLSEGRVRYETVERTSKGLQPRLIEREGPTGFLTTTTAVRLHPENETRMLSIPVADTPEQTAAVLRAQAEPSRSLDGEPFHALQRWLETGERRVVIPFARQLAREIPPVAVRLRRDFGTVLALIRAHALLHRATRARTDIGEILATFDDYGAVRDLVADLVSEGVAATVSTNMRETVEAVRNFATPPDVGVSVAAVARRLGLDESAAFRRVRATVERGYLRNLEDRPRRPARLICGESLPEERTVLPTVDRLRDCSVADQQAGRCDRAGADL